jgi:hypothetical protein
MTRAEMTPAKIEARPTVVYSKGRGGTKWPTKAFAAVVNGVELNRKDGLARTFKTKEAALKAAAKAAQ